MLNVKTNYKFNKEKKNLIAIKLYVNLNSMSRDNVCIFFKWHFEKKIGKTKKIKFD